MSNSVVQAGSPLADYFNDEVESQSGTTDRVSKSRTTGEVGDTTLVEDLIDTSIESPQNETGWTGVIPNTPSSSRSSSTSPTRQCLQVQTPDKGRDSKQMEMDAFGERFKYLICTSGLLEKVYVPCLGGSITKREQQEEETDDQVISDHDTDLRDTGTDGLRSHANEAIFLWLGRMNERPDIALAGLVLVLAMAWVIGWKVFWLGAVITIGVCGTFWKRRRSGQLAAPVRAVRSSTVQPPQSRLEPVNETLATLQLFLDASTSLDTSIDSALSVFKGYPDSSSSHHDLRLAIHRLTETMTDHLATATSTLLEMVDRTELGILGEMYDIPIGPGSDRRGRANTDLSDDQEHLNSLKRLSWNASKPLIPLSLPMGTSSSSPARLRLDRKHTVHLSLGAMPLEDRFTTVPKRTARAVKRSSWAPEWNDRIANGTDLISLATKASSTCSSELQNSFSDESRETELPKTPNPQRSSTPRKSSPLSRRDSTSSDSHMPQRHIFPIVPPTPAKYPLLPSPFKSPIREDQKRRSLQSMPYFHSDRSDITSPGRASISGSSDMGRSTSLQVSDLQILRDQSTNGLIAPNSIDSFASSRMFSQGLGYGNTPTRPSRMVRSPSLSPLTLPGLKAACLGVHIKRRRMACCLLGLKFDQDEEYWMEVHRVLDDLVVGINAAVESLRTAEQEAKGSSQTLRPVQSIAAAPPWLNGHRAPRDQADYAPRTSGQTLLVQQINEMQATLHHTWTSLEALRPAIESIENLEQPWANVRGDLGDLVRHWERGKDVVSRLNASSECQDVEPEEGEGDLQPLPTFLRAWNEEQEPSSAATDPVRSTSVDTHDTFSSHAHDIQLSDFIANEILPPPGQDMVFESVPMPVNAQRSKLSREERIRLMKEAREQSAQRPAEREVADLGGDVVGELKSMIDIIRKRKGIPETEPNPVVPMAVDKEVSSRERPSLPMGFADDLRKAFVFPTSHVEHDNHNQS